MLQLFVGTSIWNFCDLLQGYKVYKDRPEFYPSIKLTLHYVNIVNQSLDFTQLKYEISVKRFFVVCHTHVFRSTRGYDKFVKWS